MSLRKKPLLALGFVLLALVVLIFVVPPLMEHSIAAWLRYEARRSGLVVSFSEIHAPLFRPVEIRELKILGAGLDADHVEFDAGRIEAGLSFAAFFGDRKSRTFSPHFASSMQNSSSVA